MGCSTPIFLLITGTSGPEGNKVLVEYLMAGKWYTEIIPDLFEWST